MSELIVLRERHAWLRERIKAKKVVGWDTEWDEREHKALGWAIAQLSPNGEPV